MWLQCQRDLHSLWTAAFSFWDAAVPETELLGDRKKRCRGKSFTPHGDCIRSLLLFGNLLLLSDISLPSDSHSTTLVIPGIQIKISQVLGLWKTDNIKKQVQVILKIKPGYDFWITKEPHHGPYSRWKKKKKKHQKNPQKNLSNSNLTGFSFIISNFFSFVCVSLLSEQRWAHRSLHSGPWNTQRRLFYCQLNPALLQLLGKSLWRSSSVTLLKEREVPPHPWHRACPSPLPGIFGPSAPCSRCCFKPAVLCYLVLIAKKKLKHI